MLLSESQCALFVIIINQVLDMILQFIKYQQPIVHQVTQIKEPIDSITYIQILHQRQTNYYTDKQGMSQSTQITDIQQAKLVISMKQDEIKNLTNKMKMIQKKSSIKLAQNSYLIQQEKNKVNDLQKKMEKLKQTHQLQLKKFEETQDRLKNQINKLKQSINQLQKNQRQTERSHKAQLYEQELKLNQQKQKRVNLKRQHEFILKLFSPKQVMNALNLASIDQIVPYLKLMQRYKQKEQINQILTTQIEHYKSESMKVMEESFTKLNSYQQVVSTLKQKNEQLQQIMLETQKNLQEKHIQLEEKSSMLVQIEAFTNQKYSQMSQQIESLRRSVQNYQRQSLNYQNSKQEHEKNLKFIFQLTAEFQRKEQDYIHRIMEFQKAFDALQRQKAQIEAQYRQSQYNFKEYMRDLQNAVERTKGNVADKEQIIKMLSNSIKQLEHQCQSNKQQLDKSKNQISELLRRKHRLQEQLREAQEFYFSKQQSLLQEIQMLKTIQQFSGDFKSNQRKQSVEIAPTSLEDQLQPEPNWFQLYQNCLQRHNKFIREVHYLLRKQQRNQQVN